MVNKIGSNILSHRMIYVLIAIYVHIYFYAYTLNFSIIEKTNVFIYIYFSYLKHYILHNILT